MHATTGCTMAETNNAPPQQHNSQSSYPAYGQGGSPNESLLQPMHNPSQHYYSPPAGIPVSHPIPGNQMTSMVRGSLRMQLMQAYPKLNRYTPTADESAMLSLQYSKSWVSFVAEVVLPTSIFLMSGEKGVALNVEEKPVESKLAKLLRDKRWNWTFPKRILAAGSAFILLRTLSGVQDEYIFHNFLSMQSPMGDYSRYLLHEGQKAAEFKMATLPHPPFPAPQTAYQPSYQYQQQQYQPLQGQPVQNKASSS